MPQNFIPPPDSRGHVLAAVLGALDTLLGATLLASPASRVSSPAFDPAKHLMPMAGWGAILFVLGVWVLMITFANRRAGLGLSLAAGWFTFFVYTLGNAAAHDSRVAFTGCITYGFVVILHLLTAIGRIR